MATPKDLVTISLDPYFQARVEYYFFVSAVAVMAESNSTQGHSQRVLYANKILAGTMNLATASLAILTNSTIASEADISKSTDGDYGVPDGDIQFVANTLFSALAGVST